jgi:hypothetical protein
MRIKINFKYLICEILGIYWTLRIGGLPPISGHKFKEVFNGRRKGRYESELVCARCGEISVAWSDTPIS